MEVEEQEQEERVKAVKIGMFDWAEMSRLENEELDTEIDEEVEPLLDQDEDN